MLLRRVSASAGALPLLLPALLLGAAVGGVGCARRPGPEAGTAARVNGATITRAELDEAVNEQTAAAAAPLGASARLRLRLELLNQLIDRELLLQQAAHLGIVPTPAAVAREAEAEKLQQPELDAARRTEAARENLALRELFEREIKARIHITDADVAAYYRANASLFNVAEPSYHVREIFIASHPGAASLGGGGGVGGGAGALSPRAKLRLIEAKLKQGGDFAALAREYSDDANTADSGGDLGMIPASALAGQTPAALRAAILGLRPGRVSAPVATPRGVYLLQLVARETPGQHPESDPQVQAEIRDLLASRRELAARAALLTVLRERANIENFLAERVLADPNAPPPA